MISKCGTETQRKQMLLGEKNGTCRFVQCRVATNLQLKKKKQCLERTIKWVMPMQLPDQIVSKHLDGGHCFSENELVLEL